VEINKQNAEPRIDLDKAVQRHKLALVRSGKVEFSPTSVGAGRAMFTPAEMRHNFAIWALNKGVPAGRAAHLYYCVRCKRAFSVADRGGSVTPLDSQGNALQGSEAIKRLDTFSCGPCPACSGLTDPRLTSKVIPIQTARGHLSDLTSACRRAWEAVMMQWHRLPRTDRTTHNMRSNRK
jgi:hypothetical protein